jgi:DNA-binding HxlR family transcriptional regulator
MALLGAPVTFWCNLLKMKEIKMSPSAKSAYTQLEDVVGCKWSVSVLQGVAAGVSRPGALERHVQGISTKVLSERLRKLTTYGLLTKHVYAEVPPRTEYSLTQNGQKMVSIIGQIKLLDDQIRSAEQCAPADAKKRCR